MIKKIKKIIEIGPIKISQIILNKIKSKIGRLIIFKLIYKKNFNVNFNFLDKIYRDNLFQESLPENYKNNKYIIEQADLYSKNCFNILNSGLICFNNKIDWEFNKTDPKIPWELARFHQNFILGKAYILTQDKKYLETFIFQINSFIDNNPVYSKTNSAQINWQCPMDVAIRAINILWGLYFFEKDLDKIFLDKVINSLYEHKIFLKYNWEIFIKNNNHYLSDLLGYLYLNLFFNPSTLHKNFHQESPRSTQGSGLTKKYFKKILKELDYQILPDGSIYEGSTSYHKLVTEIFLHVYLLSKYNNLKLPEKILEKFNKSLDFLNKTYSLQIGDNDSGKILTDLCWQCQLFVVAQSEPTGGALCYKHFPNFGLTVIQNKNLKISFRHPTYNKIQTTGHFHQDNLSITLDIFNIPIIVDPGTYVYTPDPILRNFFRSVENHSVFYISDTHGKRESHPLFSLPRQEQKDTSKIIYKNNKILIKNYFPDNNLKYSRTLIINLKLNNLKIRDKISASPDTLRYAQGERVLNYQLIFHPEINIKKINQNKFLIKFRDKNLAICKSKLNLNRKKTLYSNSYGHKESTKKLFGSKKIYIPQNPNNGIIFENKFFLQLLDLSNLSDTPTSLLERPGASNINKP